MMNFFHTIIKYRNIVILFPIALFKTYYKKLRTLSKYNKFSIRSNVTSFVLNKAFCISFRPESRGSCLIYRKQKPIYYNLVVHIVWFQIVEGKGNCFKEPLNQVSWSFIHRNVIRTSLKVEKWLLLWGPKCSKFNNF